MGDPLDAAAEAPPSYTEATTTTTSTTARQQPDPQLYTAHLASHLTTIPARIRAQQSARLTHEAARDLDLVALLAPHIEAFLSDLGTLSRWPPAAELALVPEAAVPAGWELSGARERRREGEVVHLVRVAAVSASGEKGGPGGGGGVDEKRAERTGSDSDGEDGKYSAVKFDEWGRFDEPADTSSSSSGAANWWWANEGQARRLASYLQPKIEPNLSRKVVHEVVEDRVREEKKGWGWGKKSRGSESSAASSAPAATDKITSQLYKDDDQDNVTMNVRAEATTFRRENAFGMWNSMTGWTIVVAVKMRGSRR